ncbi:acyl carrier protein [Mucilaginibacter boryungensis]|uniref:Acyl carrier protein n=1 Tax=Mucilaginibacter boryungensis TaxID=768480 RepID=A0ABR9XEN8_9SPHI|nr:acyl carrier protein [Mucilaginibacter boryungensis]MBE9665847.1 acyl carrier protein [Mucilaginibacter boryungensis]
MDITIFVKNFALQFDETEPELITSDTNYKDLEEWSSLTALSIIAMVDEEYDVKLSGNDIKNATSIVDLFEIVKSKV